MEDLYLKIAERLRLQVPELDHIDEDTGQLYPAQYDDRYEYPILFPCCLIDAATVDFNNERPSSYSQRGRATVILKTAFKCDEDSHYSSSEYGNDFYQMHRRMEINRKLVRALHGVCFNRNMSPMLRTQSRSYTLPGRVKVYETTLEVNVTESLDIVE